MIAPDDQRIAHLQDKVDSLDRCTTDLRRSVEALNRLIDELRLDQLRTAVGAGAYSSAPSD